MSVTHYIDKKAKIVHVIAKGKISIEDLINQERKVIQDTDFEKGINAFIDFSEAQPSETVDLDRIKMGVDFFESIQEIRGKCKWAIFAPYEFAYSLSKFYSRFSKERLPIKTKVFKNEAEAKRWLKS